MCFKQILKCRCCWCSSNVPRQTVPRSRTSDGESCRQFQYSPSIIIIIIIISVLIKVTLSCRNISGALYGKLQKTKTSTVAGLVTKGRSKQNCLQRRRISVLSIVCLYHLIPPQRDTSVTTKLRHTTSLPKPSLCTKKYCSVNYGEVARWLRWLGGLLVERRTSVSQIRGSIPGQVAAV